MSTQTLIIPEVFADVVNEKFGICLKMGTLATDYTSDVADITTCGNKVNFPKFDRVASVNTITKGTAITPADINMSDNEADIKHTGGSIRVFDKDEKQIKGATTDKMAQQLVDAMALDLDNSLGATILSEATLFDECNEKTSLTQNDMLSAWSLFGDDVNVDSFSGVAINSRLLPSFLSMDLFINKDYTVSQNKNGIVQDNIIGFFMGVPVIMTNNGTWDSTNSECNTFIIKKGALGYVKQKEVSIEVEREGKLLCNDIIASSLYATKVIDTDGIVVIKATLDD
ncbi:MAG: hypothetical protein R3Y35_07170 [Clostridia bacterium]